MKRIITHKSPDLDAIGSAWLLLRFLQGWENAEVNFVPAGEKLEGKYDKKGEAIELVDLAETIHVDTGMGTLDHHQTEDNNVCAASLTLKYVLSFKDCSLYAHDTKMEAVKRMVDLIVNDDHFQQFYYPEADSDFHDMSVTGQLQGYKLMYPNDDKGMLDFGLKILDILLHTFEAKIWAEKEIKEKGVEFETRWGKGLAVETLNDAVLKLAQLKGYAVSVRKDPQQGFVRIKAMPERRVRTALRKSQVEKKTTSEKRQAKSSEIDLTPVYEKLMELDPDSTWFLHVSKRMLLNGSTKNPEMKGSKLTLDEVIEALKKI